MFCASCGNELIDGVKICASCGASVGFNDDAAKNQFLDRIRQNKQANGMAPMAQREYDKIIFRHINILTKLNSGERVLLRDLTKEFNVGIRTLQNDMRRLLRLFPIQHDNRGSYWFNDGYALKDYGLDTQEILMVILSLMPFKNSNKLSIISDSVMKKLFTLRIPNPFYIKTNGIEDIDLDSILLSSLQDAINKRRVIDIYTDEKQYTVEPYKIANFDGIWYLYAKDTLSFKIKTWLISRIRKVIIQDNNHQADTNTICQMLEHAHSPWFEEGGGFEVIIEIDSSVAHYFELKKFLTSQEIVSKKLNGDIVVSFDINHDEDVDNLIKAWLPHIRVISPLRLRDKIVYELDMYLQNYKTIVR